ncbi:unnamed protein product, partial [Mesorhabditis spiculigera]
MYVGNGTKVGEYVVDTPIQPEAFLYPIFNFIVEKKKEKFVLRAERAEEKEGVLKNELFILLELEKQEKLKNFPTVYDRGQEKTFNWFVLTLCGKSLRALRKEQPLRRFTLGCGISVSIQCLKALETLHDLGYIHRDVSPTNFSVGRQDTKEKRVVYCLDFGLAHQYKNKHGEIKVPRTDPWLYKGNIRYASRRCLKREELCRKDDLEMWLYMVIEFCKGSLPWCNITNKADLLSTQTQVRTPNGLRYLLGGMPIEFIKIIEAIDALGYSDDPDYNTIYGLLQNSLCLNDLEEYPWDWEEKKSEHKTAKLIKDKKDAKSPAAGKSTEPDKKTTPEKGKDAKPGASKADKKK